MVGRHIGFGKAPFITRKGRPKITFAVFAYTAQGTAA